MRHILVPIDAERGMTRTQSCTKTDVALAEIAGGIPFPEVAARISAVNPGRGGDLGFIHERDLASWMADAVAQLEAGQVSSVIEMPFGCNLLELVERREFHPLSYEDAKDVVRQQIFNERMGEEYKEFLEELRKNTFIERKGIYADATRLRPGDAFGGEGDF